MRIKSSYLFAIGLALLVGLFFLVGTLLGGSKKDSAQAKTSAAPALPSVQVVLTPESTHAYTVVIRGRTESARSVVIKSETPGTVAATPATEGAYVTKGTVLCRLNVDARQATLDQARAALRSRQLTLQASAELAKKGYRSQTQLLQDQASLDTAAATVRQAEIGIEQMSIRAPFSGVFDRRDAEVGTYLAPGQSCGTMIELDPLLIVGDLPESDTGKLRVGSPATATLLSGQRLSGQIRYLAREADAQTRTYRIEVAASNPGLRVRSGLSATVRISAGAGPAHQVPVSALVLDSAGRQGVRYVRADEVVAFAPVTVIEEEAGGVWVAGLQGSQRIITVGQSYVAEGQKVRVAAAR